MKVSKEIKGYEVPIAQLNQIPPYDLSQSPTMSDDAGRAMDK